jgi:hypothetical protein
MLAWGGSIAPGVKAKNDEGGGLKLLALGTITIVVLFVLQSFAQEYFLQDEKEKAVPIEDRTTFQIWTPQRGVNFW